MGVSTGKEVPFDGQIARVGNPVEGTTGGASAFQILAILDGGQQIIVETTCG
jgi:hypothetical protein